jgi:hypothetical protein
MPGTRRLPLHRKQTKPLVSDLALDLFEEMSKLRCTCSATVIAGLRCHRAGEGCPGCVQWWQLRPLLRRAINGRIWEEFMPVARHPPDRRRSWPVDSEEGRWLALERASEARRRVRQQGEGEFSLTPEPEPEREPDTASREQLRQRRGPSKSGNGAPDVPASP